MATDVTTSTDRAEPAWHPGSTARSRSFRPQRPDWAQRRRRADRRHLAGPRGVRRARHVAV